ncbi:hypothetical protein NC796_06165 [Aliifodinibius sp. S!AR15-10]|uniref:hypothetical protein n=1 Tax=Aliifodinibius sp. S!AR15-10 TaxID=2950437 RepID=UPI0028638C79|nr:hypothetical protein [Aliifodinibius sp. S!AR15-10]MDR8390711.1 hypothetical protein [Aliifodinibius sp. S!AR15-10]
MNQSNKTAREVVIDHLNEYLGAAEEIDIRSAVLCGEMGCGDMADFIFNHDELRRPYNGRVDNPEEACHKLHEAYQQVIRDGNGN